MIRRTTVLAVFMAVLMVATLPGGASTTNLAVGSDHTTVEEFGTGDLDNMGLVYSDDGGYMTTESPSTTTATTDVHDDTGTASFDLGVRVRPLYDIESLDVALGSGSEAQFVYVQSLDGEEIASESVSNGEATLNVSLDAGETYRLVADAGDDSYSYSQIDGGPDYPYRSDTIEIVSSHSGSDTSIFNIESADATPAHKSSTQSMYISAPHTVEDVAEGYIDLELDDAEAGISWQAHDGSSWTTVASCPLYR